MCFVPLIEDGIAANRLTPAIRRNVLCIASMNKLTLSWFAATGRPAKMAWSVLSGMLVAIITNAMPMLRRKPVVIIVAEIPAAIPRRATGEAFMIELMFGATNIPPPMPARIMGSTRIV